MGFETYNEVVWLLKVADWYGEVRCHRIERERDARHSCRREGSKERSSENISKKALMVYLLSATMGEDIIHQTLSTKWYVNYLCVRNISQVSYWR